MSPDSAPDPAAAASLIAAARELLERADRSGVALRAIGGVAVAICCPSASRAPLSRQYKDLDFVGRGSQRRQIHELFSGGGYGVEPGLAAAHGRSRLKFVGGGAEPIDVDVFLDRLVMCHTLDFRPNLEDRRLTLTPEDLLLSKLQVVERTDRDLQDIVALLSDHDLDRDRFAGVVGADWGWWRTSLESLTVAREYAASLDFAGGDAVVGQIDELIEVAEATPKSRRWQLRAKVGERKRWYVLPEEDEI